MKLSQNEYERIFKAIANLYGLATNEAIDMIIDHYYDGVIKSDTLAILEKLSKKHREMYFYIKRIGDKGYMLISDLLPKEEDVLRINDLASKASFYFPPSKEKFLAYAEDFYSDADENLYYGVFADFISRHYKNKTDKEKSIEASFWMSVYCEMKIKSATFDEGIDDILELSGFAFKSKSSQKMLNDIWGELLLHTRMFIHRGHKVIELTSKHLNEEREASSSCAKEDDEAPYEQEESLSEKGSKKGNKA